MTISISTPEMNSACPKCDHHNASWRSVCEICRIPLDGSINSTYSALPERPGCLSAYALFIGAVGVIATFFGLSELSSQEGFLAVVIILIAGFQISLAWGLWNQKNWSRVVVIILQSLNIVGGIFWLLSGNLLQAILTILVGGFLVHWFANNGEYFA